MVYWRGANRYYYETIIRHTGIHKLYQGGLEDNQSQRRLSTRKRLHSASNKNKCSYSLKGTETQTRNELKIKTSITVEKLKYSTPNFKFLYAPTIMLLQRETLKPNTPSP
jgi:hypothetical protein